MEETKDNWVVTCTFSDEEIKEFGQVLLESPAMTVNLFSEEKGQNLYSEEQMLEMFREGCLAVLRQRYKSKTNKRNSKPPRPFPILRDMKVGESVTVPFEKWQAARTAASKLKRDFGCVFIVRKIARNKEVGEIEILRKS